ncbi:hypothetical protein [Bradyrhizobium sp.]|uniref:hypothetical protein n=1 Tax=Bradyrhizobium sp. TaxID=376 RepID=UPI001ED66718|nr:hypothetical protein [Bradyrhizobium sp.]MBV8922239.1 hypothetical protein [Bradyrhizobium sp.]MBV9981043.1 hypothetical protein [Bradyrhizobium sp.]
MTALFCSAFQFFHSFGKAFETQPLAPYLLLEVTLAVLLLFASITIALQVASGRVRPLDLFFFLFPLVWLTLSAGFAWLMFDQPPIFGIGEDRRILTFLYWFAFDAVRRRFGLTVTDILRALVLCACIYLIVAIGLQIIVPDRLSGRAIPDLDTRRLRMSAPGDCFAITFLSGLVGSLVSRHRAINLLALTVGLVGLLQVAQTRQLTLAALAAAVIIIWLWRPHWALALAAAGTAAFLVTISLRGPVVFEQLVEAVVPNMQEFFGANLAENARINTLGIVVGLLEDNHFLGLGAVSLLHDGGLARIYGRDFFVNDVGFLGEVFRVGLFYCGFLAVYAAIALKLWQRVGCAQHRALIAGLYLFYFLQAPTDGFFYRLGFVHAFLFLLMAAAAARSRQTSAEWRQAPSQPTVSARAL